MGPRKVGSGERRRGGGGSPDFLLDAAETWSSEEGRAESEWMGSQGKLPGGEGLFV